MNPQDLNKSIETFIDELFTEPVKKGENFEVAPAAKTTADKVMSEVPGSQDDKSRGAGRPDDDHDVPKTDQDGNPAKGYDAVQKEQPEEENPEAKKQSGASTQISSEGRLGGDKPGMKDPRLSKSLTDEEFAEYQELKKAKEAEAKKAKEQEDLKKAETARKAQEDLIKSAVEASLSPLRKENEELKKSFAQQSALLKAIAGQPVQAKSITGIDAINKASDPDLNGPREFTRQEKLDAAERLVKSNKLPVDAVIELENTHTLYNPQWRALVEQELEKQN